MTLIRKDVEKVALLSRLRLTDAELATMTEQLASIVSYVEQLGEIDVSQVAPMSHPLDVANVFRDDTVVPSFDRSAILANAPHADEQCYLVPAVLGE